MAAQLSGISTTPTQFSIIYENADSAICPIVQVIDGDVKEYWTQYPPLDFTISDRLYSVVADLQVEQELSFQ